MSYRPRRDIDDLDDSLFDRDEAQRLRQERAETVERGERANAAFAEADALAAARVRAGILKANDEFIMREYLSAGVMPPILNADGIPAVSLSMLFRLGWTVEEFGHGVRKLVAPAKEQRSPEKNK